MRIDHWDRDWAYWGCSHQRKIHSCIESTSDLTLRSHTRPKLDSLLLFLSKTLRYHLQSERCSYLFFFMKMVIRLSHTNRIEYCYALDASFRNYFLKRTKYYAKHYYRKPFGLKQDMQILVGRRRPFGTPLPTQPCVIRVTFTEWPNPFTTRLTRWYLWKCSYPKIFRIVLNDLTVLPDNYRDENRVLPSQGNF